MVLKWKVVWLILLLTAIPLSEIAVYNIVVRPTAIDKLVADAASSEILRRTIDQQMLSVIYDVRDAFDEKCDLCYGVGVFQRAERVLSGDDYRREVASYEILPVCKVQQGCIRMPNSNLYYRKIEPVVVPPRSEAKKCEEGQLLFYATRICEATVLRGADIEAVSWELQLEPPLFDVGTRAFGEGEMKSTMAISIDLVRGICANIDYIKTLHVPGCVK